MTRRGWVSAKSRSGARALKQTRLGIGDGSGRKTMARPQVLAGMIRRLFEAGMIAHNFIFLINLLLFRSDSIGWRVCRRCCSYSPGMQVCGAERISTMVNINGDWAEFRFYRPDAATVYLVGDFNDWREDQLAMVRRSDGDWVAKIRLPVGKEALKLGLRVIINISSWHATVVGRNTGLHSG